MAYVAPMDRLANVEDRAIPLECVLCPRKPKFSDVSHLLTHVSSKTHLSNEFRVKLQAGDHHDAAETLQRYNDWYDDNGINLLLKERLQAKDTKKPGNAARRRTGTNRTNASGSSTNIRGQRQNKQRVESMENQALKAEPDATFPAPGGFPPMGHFNTAALDSHSLQQADHDVFFDGGAFPNYSVKNERVHVPFEGYSNDPFRAGIPILRSSTQTPDSAIPSTIDLDLSEEADGISKLKGTVWPGMNMFDSATPDQKRKRNQRKDRAVIEQMKSTSLAVTATECIWSPHGEFQRERDIYASPSIDGSLDDDHVAVNQKKKRAKRSDPVPADAEDAPSSVIRPGLRSSARLASRNRLLGDHDEPETEVVVKKEKKPAGGKRTKKAEGLDIFQDPRQDSPGRTLSPGEDKRTGRFTLPHHSAVPLADMSTNESMLMASPTPATKQHSTRFFSNPMEARSFPFQQPTTFAPSFLPGLSGSTHNPLYGHPQQRLAMSYHRRLDIPVFDVTQLANSAFPHHYPFNMDSPSPFAPQPRDNNGGY